MVALEDKESEILFPNFPVYFKEDLVKISFSIKTYNLSKLRAKISGIIIVFKNAVQKSSHMTILVPNLRIFI